MARLQGFYLIEIEDGREVRLNGVAKLFHAEA